MEAVREGDLKSPSKDVPLVSFGAGHGSEVGREAGRRDLGGGVREEVGDLVEPLVGPAFDLSLWLRATLGRWVRTFPGLASSPKGLIYV
jgi:hypothetical protein